MGTEFYVYDSGLNPKEVDKAAARSGTVNVREELGLVTYVRPPSLHHAATCCVSKCSPPASTRRLSQASNVLGSKGPRKMKVCLPRVTKGQRRQFKPLTKESELMAKYKSKDLSDVQMLINKPPRWNERKCRQTPLCVHGNTPAYTVVSIPTEVGAYVLNFNGRVTMASVKNFQLVDPDDRTCSVQSAG